jgi:FkbM family methyltransferase
MSNSMKGLLGRALGRRPKKKRKKGGRVTRDINGFRMHLDLDDGGISRIINSRGGREEGFMYVLNREIHEGMVCLDLGANLGYATLPMCRWVGPSGYVYAVEPSAQNLSLLRPSIEDNFFAERCEITQGLISEKTGTMKFWLSDKSNLGSVSKRQHSVEEVELQAWSLPDFMKDRRPVNLIKMDVEGHEVEILRGGLEYFRSTSHPCKILIEAHQSVFRPEDPFEPILEGYFDCGFRGRYLISTPTHHPRIFKEAGYSPREVFYTDERTRGLYEDVPREDFIRLACYRSDNQKANGRVRALMIQRD